VLLALALVVRLLVRLGGIALLVLWILLVALFSPIARLAGLLVALLAVLTLLAALTRGIPAVLVFRITSLGFVAMGILLLGFFLGGFT
jgi:hypothetical protein